MQFLVLGWLVLEVTGDKTQLGLTISLYGLPNIAFLMAGGIIADRFDRKLLLMVTQAIVGAMIAGLAVLTLAESVALWHIYLSAALLGVLQALNMPARLAMLADLVGERRLLDAVAQFNAAQHAGRIVGPPVAGILIDQVGLGLVLVLNAACYGASVLLLTMVRGSYKSAGAGRQPLLRHLGDGLSVIRDTPMLLTVLVMTCVFGGFGMAHLAGAARLRQGAAGQRSVRGRTAAAGFRDRRPHRHHDPDLHAPRLAVPLAALLPGHLHRAAYPVRLERVDG